MGQDSDDSRRDEPLGGTADSSSRARLAALTIQSLTALPRSQDSLDTAELLMSSLWVSFDDAVTSAAMQTARFSPGSILRHLGHLFESPSPWTLRKSKNRARMSLMGLDNLWLEISNSARVIPNQVGNSDDIMGSSQIDRVGFLLARDPGEEGHVAIFVSWQQSDGMVNHAAPILHWHGHELLGARDGYRRSADQDAFMTLMNLGKTTIPSAFAEETAVMNGIAGASRSFLEETMMTARRQVMGEYVFLLALLLMMESHSIETDETWMPGSGNVPGRPGILVRMGDIGNSLVSSVADRLYRRRGGFSTSPLGGPMVWRRPTPQL